MSLREAGVAVGIALGLVACSGKGSWGAESPDPYAPGRESWQQDCSGERSVGGDQGPETFDLFDGRLTHWIEVAGVRASSDPPGLDHFPDDFELKEHFDGFFEPTAVLSAEPGEHRAVQTIPLAQDRADAIAAEIARRDGSLVLAVFPYEWEGARIEYAMQMYVAGKDGSLVVPAECKHSQERLLAAIRAVSESEGARPADTLRAATIERRSDTLDALRGELDES